ncbi:hypothetical protein ABBQ38_002768 [Trebouxia sp. C0009 RCD-2024]
MKVKAFLQPKCIHKCLSGIANNVIKDAVSDGNLHGSFTAGGPFLYSPQVLHTPLVKACEPPPSQPWPVHWHALRMPRLWGSQMGASWGRAAARQAQAAPSAHTNRTSSASTAWACQACCVNTLYRGAQNLHMPASLSSYIHFSIRM